MKATPFRAALLALTLLGGSLAGVSHVTLATAAEVSVGTLTLAGGFTRATLPNAPVGGGFLTITNSGTEPDRLIAATSPAAGEVQIHEMKMEGDVMKMAELPDGLVIPAGETVTLAPGGFHLMFMQLKQGFVEGTKIAVTLTFEKAGTVDVELDVGGIAAKAPAHDMGHDMGHDATHGEMSHETMSHDTMSPDAMGAMADPSAHDAHQHHGAAMAVDTAGMSDEEAIGAMQKAMFDTPDSPLTMGPIAVSGEYAVSDWAQGDTGGRALLRKTETGWAIHLCSGAALKDAGKLVEMGVPEAAAQDIAQKLAAAEAAVAPDLLAQFSAFDGVMMVNEHLM